MSLLGGGVDLRDQDHGAVLLVPHLVGFSFTEYLVVVGLGDADELAVVLDGLHHAPVVQLLHGRGDPEAVPEAQGRLRRTAPVVDLDL